jgi:predicted SAM-dependent methyltransferase
VKVNFACGKMTWDGFYCIDAVQHSSATRQVDLLHAFTFYDNGILRNPLPLDMDCATEVHCYHFIEHVYQWEAPAVIKEFRRILKPGGKLVMECPNIELAARNLIAGGPRVDQMAMWPLYGDPKTRDPYMCHRWGYTKATMKELLRECGMKEISFAAPQTHGKRKNRDMRVECIT